MPGGEYGPGGKWIHDRAHHLLQKSDDMDKGTAYALATQQAHRLGKSPKSFRTSSGVREAKQKFDKPRSDYKKTAEAITAAYFEKVSLGAGVPTPTQSVAETLTKKPSLANEARGKFFHGKGVGGGGRASWLARKAGKVLGGAALAGTAGYGVYKLHKYLTKKNTADSIVDAWLLKSAAGPPPAIPTPKFPTGLQRVTPTSVKSMSTAQPGKTMANTYTQVHTQPPAVNSAPYSGVKSVSPPPATR